MRVNIMTNINTNKKTKEVKLYDDKELNSLPTKSAKIRYLTSKGLTRSAIAKLLDIRYQHVRNVQVTLLKKDM